MRLVTILEAGGSRPALVIGGDIVRPLPLPPEGPRDVLALIRDWARWRPVLNRLLSDVSAPQLPLAATTLGPPLANPGKVVAIGLNYVDHASESQQALPAEPLVFAKFPSSIVGPGEAISWDPGLTHEVDFEAEMAVIIGRRARNVGAAEAMSYVFGYTCLNDVSARDLQFSDGQWVRAKSLDSFCPVGPWIVTADELPDPQRLRISCRVSGEVLQDATTADMVFSVAELVARLSRSFTLDPGDILATGTPPGVGYFRVPKRLLHDGDTVTVAIEGIGELINPVRVGSVRGGRAS